MTEQAAAELILQAYKRKYMDPMDELHAEALMMAGSRSIQRHLLLAKVLAVGWLYENNYAEYQRLARAMPSYRDHKRILKNPPYVLVLMIAPIERSWLLWRALRWRGIRRLWN